MLTAPRETRPKRGRHRATNRWGLYRSSHRDADGNLVSLLIPAWRTPVVHTRPADGRPRSTVDLSAIPALPLPLRPRSLQPKGEPRDQSEAASTTAPSPETITPERLASILDMVPVRIPHHGADWRPTPISFEVIVPPPVVEVEESASNDPHSVILGPIIDLRAGPAAAAQSTRTISEVVTETPSDSPEASVVVDRAVMLPPAGKERGTFANMLGFGEDEVYFGPTASIQLDQPARSHRLIAHVVTQPVELMPPDPEQSDWDELPGLADVRMDNPTDTQTLVARLWDATNEEPILGHVDVPEPSAPSRVLLGSKRWRWSVLGGLAISIVLVFVAGSAIGRAPIEAARERAVAYSASAQQLADSLGPLDDVIGDIATLDAPEFDLGALVAVLDDTDGVAREVAALTSEPLPNPALLGSSVEIDRLRSPQELLQRAAARASAVERRLGDALTYQLGMADSFRLPDLPVVAAPTEVGEIGAGLSVAFSSTAVSLGSLPDDPFFASHKRAATELLSDLQERQIDYLDALRQSDSARAGIARREIVASVDAIRGDLGEPLGAMSRWAEDQLAGLAELIESVDEQLD